MANTKITTNVIADGAITSAKLDTNITISGDITGTLATAAQPNITSLGTLTALTVDDITINGSTISDSGDLTIDTEADLTLTALSDIIHQTTSTNSSAGHHIFKSFNTEIMRIDGGNNRVGIGNNNPDTKLTVGTFGDTARAAAFNGGSILIDGGAASEIIIGDGNVAYMSIQTTDNATAMKIRNFSGNSDLVTIERATGNVGIGTDSPFSSARLQVNTGTNLNLAVQTGTTITNGMKINAFNDAGSANIPLEINGSVMLLKTGETERLRIDSSGNLMVGTTNDAAGVGNTNAGVSIRGGSDNRSFFSVNGNYVMHLNRNTNDGNILEFAKNGVHIGQIGTYGGTTYIGSTAGGIMFNGTDIEPTSGSTARADNSIDLGSANYRFKDAFLGDGVYLGGTGAANKLDDYEEGTWTPDIRRNDGNVSATFTVASGTATYVKIGRLVYVKAFISSISDGSSNGSSYWRINGTPFAGKQYSGLLLGYNSTPADGVYIGDAGGNLILTVGAAPFYGSIGSNKELMLAFTYETDS